MSGCHSSICIRKTKSSAGGAFAMGHTHSVYCGDETLLVVTFKPVNSRLIYCNDRSVESKKCPTVYKVRLIGIVSIAISLVCACAHI